MNVLTGAIAKLVGEVEGLKSSKNVDAALAGGIAGAGGPGAAALAAANAASGALGGSLGMGAFNNQLGFMATQALTNAANAVSGAHNACLLYTSPSPRDS